MPPKMGLAKLRRKGKAVGMASARSHAAMMAAKTRLYDTVLAKLYPCSYLATLLCLCLWWLAFVLQHV